MDGKFMRIELITMWYNEEFLAPFFLNHYSWVDKIHLILDADTTDRTEAIARQYPNVEIEQFRFPDMMNDILKVNKFNEKYRSLKDAEYVILADSDEFIFCNHVKKPVRDHIEATMKDVYFVNLWQVYKHERIRRLTRRRLSPAKGATAIRTCSIRTISSMSSRSW